jgi:hypothetical protein
MAVKNCWKAGSGKSHSSRRRRREHRHRERPAAAGFVLHRGRGGGGGHEPGDEFRRRIHRSFQGSGEEATFTEPQLADLLALGKAGIRELLAAQEAALAQA